MFSCSPFRAPVLMYHRIADPERGNPILWKYAVPPRLFDSQMRYLSLAGYQPISVADMGECMLGNMKMPRKPIVLTFDDGYLDTYTHAAPILRKYGFTATIYIVAGLIGGANEWEDSPKIPVIPLMNVDQIRKLSRLGFDIGAHTLTHPRLTQIPLERACEEVRKPKSILEELIGAPVKTFCYPYGPTSINDQICRIVAESGYTAACGTNPGLNYPDTDRYELKRFWPKANTIVPKFAYMICKR